MLTLHEQEHGERVRRPGGVIQLRDNELVDRCWRARAEDSHECPH